jgi:transcription antitermination factor NusG
VRQIKAIQSRLIDVLAMQSPELSFRALSPTMAVKHLENVYETSMTPALATPALLYGTADQERAEPSWFAIQTWPRYEKKVAAELERKEVQVFLPLSRAKHQWSDRLRTVEMPLFPTYVFVRIHATTPDRAWVLRSNGVSKFVGARGTGSTVPESEIESVRALVSRGSSFEIHPFLNVGQRVRICGGSLHGVEGILQEKNSDRSLVVSIQLIQRSLSIRLAGYQIEAA